MPELPEVEITARRLDAALRGALVERTAAPGMVALKTVEPPLGALEGARVAAVGRIGKMLAVKFDADLCLLVHLMSAGRLQLHDRPASRRDRAARITVGLADGRELRLVEFGKRQRAWGKLYPAGDVDEDELVATLGPDAWPAPDAGRFAELIGQPRHLHPMLRDQRVIAGIGRTWVDEILWQAKLSPFKQGSELGPADVEGLRDALAVLGAAVEHYEEEVGQTVPTKLPMPLRVHKREGEPCARCRTELAAVHFSEHSTTYCPQCQTGGRVLKDRRLSRLLK